MTWNPNMDEAPRDGTYFIARVSEESGNLGAYANRPFAVKFIGANDWALYPGFSVTTSSLKEWMPLPPPEQVE